MQKSAQIISARLMSCQKMITLVSRHPLVHPSSLPPSKGSMTLISNTIGELHTLADGFFKL